jgi:enoyl-CoA hydratase/carnithine racemase
MTRSYERIKVGRAGAVETITLSNPQRRNAIGPQMISELVCALGDARASDDVRSIVLTGEGRAFCSGGDFGGASVESMSGGSGDPRDFVDLLLALYRSDKPVIAKVNGDALGGGLGLAAASTFSVASTAARLGTPEIDLGLFPMMIMAVLGRHVPRRRLIEMMIFGEKINAEEAVRVGLVNQAVAPDELDAEVGRLTDRIAGKSAVAIRLGLRALAAQDDLDLEQALPLLRARFFECLATDDAREGLLAFVEKRAPKWTGQ